MHVFLPLVSFGGQSTKKQCFLFNTFLLLGKCRPRAYITHNAMSPLAVLLVANVILSSHWLIVS